MKVILQQDVANLGKKNDVKEVKPGFAQNMLFPRGLAVEATDEEIQKIDALRIQSEKIEKDREEKLNSLIDSLNGKIFELKVPANDQGHLFSKLKIDEILKVIGNDEAREVINLHEIKELGEHQVKIENGNRKGVFILKLS